VNPPTRLPASYPPAKPKVKYFFTISEKNIHPKVKKFLTSCFSYDLKAVMKLNISKINRELQRLGISKPQFAERIGITKQAVYYIFEHESARFRTIEDIARALDLDPKDLLI
jgi:DNA-binding Xre family transcriptional regulator